MNDNFYAGFDKQVLRIERPLTPDEGKALLAELERLRDGLALLSMMSCDENKPGGCNMVAREVLGDFTPDGEPRPDLLADRLLKAHDDGYEQGRLAGLGVMRQDNALLASRLDQAERELAEAHRGIKVQANAVRVLGLKERAEYLATQTIESEREMNCILSKQVEDLERELERLKAENAELLEHERQTHEKLGAILGTDDSFLVLAVRMKAENARLTTTLDEFHAVAEHVALREENTLLRNALASARNSLVFEVSHPEPLSIERRKYLRDAANAATAALLRHSINRFIVVNNRVNNQEDQMTHEELRRAAIECLANAFKGGEVAVHVVQAALEIALSPAPEAK